MWLKGSPYQKNSDLYAACIIFTSAVALTIGITRQLHKYREELWWSENQEKYNICTDIHIHKDKATIYYQPLFYARRILFVLLPTLLYALPNQQLQL